MLSLPVLDFRCAPFGPRHLGLSLCPSWQSGVLHNLWGSVLFFAVPLWEAGALDFHHVLLGNKMSWATFGGSVFYVVLTLLGCRRLELSSRPSWKSNVLGNLWCSMLYVALPLLGRRRLGLSSRFSWRSRVLGNLWGSGGALGVLWGTLGKHFGNHLAPGWRKGITDTRYVNPLALALCSRLASAMDYGTCPLLLVHALTQQLLNNPLNKYLTIHFTIHLTIRFV